MTYQLRDRPDGQVEIILSKPILVGIFPERETAQRICTFLQEDAADLPEDQPAGFATASADVEDAATVDLSRIADEVAPAPRVRAPRRPNPVSNLPAVVPERPQQAAQLVVTPPQNLTEDQLTAALGRVMAGEKIADVAPYFGLTMYQLRGLWANHKRRLQKHMAAGGPQKCAQCDRQFMPSLSSPDLCARCNHE